MKALLALGADPNFRDNNGFSPLDSALVGHSVRDDINESKPIVLWLLAYGAKKEISDALHCHMFTLRTTIDPVLRAIIYKPPQKSAPFFSLRSLCLRKISNHMARILNIPQELWEDISRAGYVNSQPCRICYFSKEKKDGYLYSIYRDRITGANRYIDGISSPLYSYLSSLGLGEGYIYEESKLSGLDITSIGPFPIPVIW